MNTQAERTQESLKAIQGCMAKDVKKRLKEMIADGHTAERSKKNHVKLKHRNGKGLVLVGLSPRNAGTALRDLDRNLKQEGFTK